MGDFWKSGIIGIVTGFANGLFGSGGGTIVVPAMEKFLKMETHKAHATAISIILPLSILSAIIYISGDLDLKAILCVSAGGIVGGYIGAKIFNKISSIWLHRLFAIFMIAAAVRMIL